MAEMKTGTKFVIGIAILGILRLLYTIVREFVKVTARAIVYFGLYVPFFYFLVGCVMVGCGAFRFEQTSVNSILFYVGLALCCAVAAVLWWRSSGHKPVSSVTEGSQQAIRKAAEYRRQTRLPKSTHERRKAVVQEERPMVYYSEVEPNLLIHEYSDHFDVYYDDKQHPLRFLRTEEKRL